MKILQILFCVLKIISIPFAIASFYIAFYIASIMPNFDNDYDDHDNY